MATCVVSGTFTDPQGSAVSGAVVRFNLDTPMFDASNNLLMPKEVTTTTAANGTWSLTLIQSISGVLTLDLNPTTSAPVLKYKFSVIVPNTSTATFASVWVENPSFSGYNPTNPLSFSNIPGQLLATQLPSLPDGQIWVGSSVAQATPLTVTGDVSLTDTGVTSIAAATVTGKLLTGFISGAGTVSATDSILSAINKLDGNTALKAPIASPTFTGTVTAPTFVGALTGNASGSAASFTGNLTGDTTSVGMATSIAASTVTGKAITGFVSGSGTVAATDTILSAINKLDGNTALKAPLASPTFTGTVTAPTFSGALTGNVTGTASGNTTYSANQFGVVVSGSGNAMSVVAPDASTSKVLTSGGTGAAPTWQTPAASPTFSYEALNCGLAASVASSALTIALKQSDGATDPSSGASAVKIGFRSSTLTSGAYNERSVTAALSLVIPSGATLGVASGAKYPIYVYALDNSGVVELAVSSSWFDENNVQSTTAISASATGNDVLYSTTARTNVPIRLLFRMLSTQTTAGTWAAVPTTISPNTLNAPLTLRAADFATTRVTGANPTNYGEYRSQLRNASAQTWSDTNGAPTATPGSANGYRIYSGNGFTTIDTTNQPTRYDVFVGKNKSVQVVFYATTGRTGYCSNTVVSTANSIGYTNSYDPTTGCVGLAAVYFSGSETAHHGGLDQNGVVLESPYFDIFITDNRVGQ